MSLYRKTAIVHLELPSGATAERLPLTTDRAFGVFLTVDGQSLPAGYFYSPINDEQWRDFSKRLSDCNVRRSTDDTAYRNATFVRDIGLSLYKSLAGLNPQLQAFLDETGTPRRLVIQTTRPELHLLPWGALCAGGSKLLASEDLSVVQAFDDFSASVAVTQSKLNLLSVLGPDISFSSMDALKQLPPEIVALRKTDTGDPDILHVEAHGDKVTDQIGGVSSTQFGDSYAKATIALLWSCYSSSADSWGDSPALWLHRKGAKLVLSFQAELNVLDASSIAKGLYGDVFGAAASRNPESALVRIRSDKFAKEFSYANWASMTVYLRCPLDLSALPLNGPRVPKAQWLADTPVASEDAAVSAVAAVFAAEVTQLADAAEAVAGGDGGTTDSGDGSDAADDSGPDTPSTSPSPDAVSVAADAAVPGIPPDPWAAIANEIRKLQPGSWKQMAAPVDIPDTSARLPMSAFGGWRGNVIRLDGGGDPLTRQIFSELDLLRVDPPGGDTAERLVWFFDKISHYGSPLIVWTNSLPRHMEFLKTIEPSPALTFLMLSGEPPPDTIPSLVDQNRLDDARKKCETLGTNGSPVSDEVLSAAYYACVRGVQPDLAKQYLTQLSNFQEWLLLTGNLFSRDKKNVLGLADLIALGGRFVNPPAVNSSGNALGVDASGQDGPGVPAAEFAQLRRPEDFYRLAMNQPEKQSSARETARAKHELGYLMECQGRPGTAEVFYKLALDDLESCSGLDDGTRHDSRWYFALSSVLRDLANLLSGDKDRLTEASALLKRAMAIQSYHGMRLQLGYSETTAARIALTGCRYIRAIHNAVNAANRMEACKNWSGWGEALGILFDTMAETRETARMISMANLANEKIRASNLSPENIADQERIFKYQKAKAHWIAGDMVEARDELEDVASDLPEEEKSGMDREIDRLLSFLRVQRPFSEIH